MQFGNIDIAMFTTLLVSVPESVGVLVFGLGFTSIAILARRLFEQPAGRDANENTGNKA